MPYHFEDESLKNWMLFYWKKSNSFPTMLLFYFSLPYENLPNIFCMIFTALILLIFWELGINGMGMNIGASRAICTTQFFRKSQIAFFKIPYTK